MDNKVKYLIIGAGISGLSFAYQKKDQDYLILERDSVCGGLCRSFYQDGFVWDVAGHFFHFHRQDTKDFYEKLTAHSVKRMATKCAKVFYGNQSMDAPFQYNIHQLPKDEFLECLSDLYYAETPEEKLPFDEFVRRKYGRGIAEKFLIPYNEKLYACKMNDLDQNAMGAFLPNLDFSTLMSFFKGINGKTYNDVFSYPVNGCMEIINALVEQLDEKRIHLDEAVTRIDPEKKLVYTTEATYSYEYLINSAALNVFAGLVGDERTGCLNYNKVLVLNLGFDKGSIDKDVSWIYFPGKEFFYRVGFYNNIAGTERLSLYVEIGYNAHEKIDVESALNATLADLKATNIISDHQLISYNTYVIDPGYAHITVEGKKYTNQLIAKMEEKNIYMVGRYARWEYSAMDDSLEQAQELAKKI